MVLCIKGEVNNPVKAVRNKYQQGKDWLGLMDCFHWLSGRQCFKSTTKLNHSKAEWLWMDEKNIIFHFEAVWHKENAQNATDCTKIKIYAVNLASGKEESSSS